MISTNLRRRCAFAAALPLLAAPLLVASPASAETMAGSDATQDVQRYDANAFTHRLAPRHADGDLQHFSVQYMSDRIRIAETFRRLDHSEPVLAVGGTFKLPSGNTRDIVLRAQTGSWQGKAHLAGKPACAIGHHIDYATARAVIVVPTSCLNTPRWVRFEAASVTTDDWKNPTYFFADAAPGSVQNDKYTARIHRG